jgi:hypothetical protein
VAQVKSDWDTWNTRPLAEDPIVRLILDGTVVRVIKTAFKTVRLFDFRIARLLARNHQRERTVCLSEHEVPHSSPFERCASRPRPSVGEVPISAPKALFAFRHRVRLDWDSPHRVRSHRIVAVRSGH